MVRTYIEVHYTKLSPQQMTVAEYLHILSNWSTVDCSSNCIPLLDSQILPYHFYFLAMCITDVPYFLYFRVEYDSFDILTDEEVRQGLKTYSDWPTYPQLYVNGELIGGLDIVKEMVASGELKSLLSN